MFKNRKHAITIKKHNREFINLTTKLYFRLKISKMLNLKKNFFINLSNFLKL